MNTTKKSQIYWHFIQIFTPLFLLISLLCWVIYAELIAPQNFGHKDNLITALCLTTLIILGLSGFLVWNFTQKEAERRIQEEYTRLNEARFRTLLYSAPDAIIIANENHTIQMLNDQAEKWFGYSREELIGKQMDILLPESLRQTGLLQKKSCSQLPNATSIKKTSPEPKDLEKASAQDHSVISNQEAYGLRKDGSTFPMELNLSPASFGPETLITMVVRDITTRKEMEEAKLQAQKRFSELLNHLPVGVFRISGEKPTFFSEANPAMVDLFAAESQQYLLETPLTTLFYDYESWYNFQSQLKSDFVSRTFEVHFRKLNGQDFYGSLAIAVKRKSDSLFYNGILEDITKRKKQNEQIRMLNEHLNHRTAELELINRELESFSYSVSHDLRAPLRAMDGFSSTLLTEYSDKLDERGRDRLQRIRSAAQKMAGLIDDLLNLSRVSRTEVKRETVNLTELAKNVIAELQQANPHQTVNFHIKDHLTVQGDRALLNVVFTNLISNAWKFTSKTDNPTIEVGCHDTGGETVYFVKDNGVGFDMEFSNKLFGAFQRLHDSEEFPGTGIGLATVQRVIHKHGGKIWAKGTVGKGAIFYFTLKNGNEM